MQGKPTFFEFTSYLFEPEKKRILFHYTQYFDGRTPLMFTETVLLPKAINRKQISEVLLKNLLGDLHIVLGVSYYKFYASGIVRHNYRLSKKEADFWNTIYREGLGEFYYRNRLDPKKAPRFSFDKKFSRTSYPLPKNNNYLVALSGGKDSIVATELLREQGRDVTALFTETNRKIPLVTNLAEKMGVKLIKIQRFLDWQVFQPHKYDGHIPISAIYGFLGIFYSVIYGYDYFVVANEYSSDIGNITYKGFHINHQWSKSSEFETLFSHYVHDHISPDVKYFSVVRPFYEIRIAEMFSQYKKYFPYFSSCNKNFTLIKDAETCLWCGECPKCVFTFILLSAFLTKKDLLAIFRKNIYANESLLHLCKDILGIGMMKPFDCVGTFEESQAAFILGSQKFKSSFIVKTLLPKLKITAKGKGELFKMQAAPNIPTDSQFLGMKNVLLMGYGKEGKISETYIKKYYPTLKIGIADQSISKNYLAMQKDFDMAIKTAGMPKSAVAIPYTTATNLFFSKIKEQGNVVIGVTGSKGKSTTSSLIYAMLKAAKKDVVHLGNIGSPMLASLLKPIPSKRIFVLELSSYQLDDIEFSPDIAVVTNLFPEHLDYHKGLNNYYQAKKNIIHFQGERDVFIYNKNNRELRAWAKNSKGKAKGFVRSTFVSKLMGKHNQDNIGAAVAVAKEFGISDAVIKNALLRFKPLPHRLEFVGKFNDITFYDDAISTTPESTILAIDSLKKVDTIFLGGQDRGYDFSQLEKAVKKYKISNAVLFPDSGEKITLAGVRVLKTRSMKKAVAFAYQYTAKGKICLLSCASPSYSLWKNFEEKGDEFKTLVKELR